MPKVKPKTTELRYGIRNTLLPTAFSLHIPQPTSFRMATDANALKSQKQSEELIDSAAALVSAPNPESSTAPADTQPSALSSTLQDVSSAAPLQYLTLDAQSGGANPVTLKYGSNCPTRQHPTRWKRGSCISTTNRSNQVTSHFNDLILLTLTVQSNAGDLTAAQWQTVLKNTHVLRGFQIREQNQGVVRAKRDGEQAECPQQHVLNVFQAFVLRPNGHPVGCKSNTTTDSRL